MFYRREPGAGPGIFIASLLTVLLTACATPRSAAPDSAAAQAVPGKIASQDAAGRVCSNERTVGSHRVTRNCVSREESEAQRKLAQEKMNRAQTRAGRSVGTEGGF